MYRLLSHEFGVVRLYRTFSKLHLFRGYKVCRVQNAPVRGGSSTVKPHQTFTKYSLTERGRYIDFQIHEFGVVRLDRTFSDYIFTGDRSALCTSSMRFKNIEPHRTLANCILTEIARYIRCLLHVVRLE